MNLRSFGRTVGILTVLAVGQLCFPPSAQAQGNFNTGLESAIDELVGLISAGANNGLPMNDMKKLDHALRDLLRVLEDMGSGSGDDGQGPLSNGLQSAQQGQGKGKGKNKHHHHHGHSNSGLQGGTSLGSAPSSGSSSTTQAVKSSNAAGISSTQSKGGGLTLGMRSAGQMFSVSGSKAPGGGSVNIVMNVKNISITENNFGNRPGSNVGQASKSGSGGTNLTLNLSNQQKTIGGLSTKYGDKSGASSGTGTGTGNSLLAMPAGFQSGTAKSGKTTAGNTTKAGSSTTLAANNNQTKGTAGTSTHKHFGDNKASTKNGQVAQAASNSAAGGNVLAMNTGTKKLTNMGQAKSFGAPSSQHHDNVGNSAASTLAGKQTGTKAGKINTHKSSGGTLGQGSNGGTHHTANLSVAKKAGNQQGLNGTRLAHHSSSVGKNNSKKK
jgi:hypothetical protein